MSWLLDIIVAVFSVMFDLARKATLRDKSRPQWFNYPLAICYCVLPVMLVVFVFISWKITAIVASVFVVPW